MNYMGILRQYIILCFNLTRFDSIARVIIVLKNTDYPIQGENIMAKQYDSHDDFIACSAVEDVLPGFSTAFYDALAREVLVEENGKFIQRDDVDLVEAARKVSETL